VNGENVAGSHFRLYSILISVFSAALFMKKTLFILFFFAAHALLAGGKTRVGSKRDTVQAVVLYGEELLFDAISDQSDEQIIQLRDSIMKHHGANELCNMINLYLYLKSRSEV